MHAFHAEREIEVFGMLSPGVEMALASGLEVSGSVCVADQLGVPVVLKSWHNEFHETRDIFLAGQFNTEVR